MERWLPMMIVRADPPKPPPPTPIQAFVVRCQDYLANNTILIITAILFLAQLCSLFAVLKTQYGTSIGLPPVGPPHDDVGVVVVSSADQIFDNDDDDEVTPVTLQNEMMVDTDEHFCGCEAMALSQLVNPTTIDESTSSTTSSQSALVAGPPFDVPANTLEKEDRPEAHANTVAIGVVVGHDAAVIFAADSVATEEEEEESSWSTAQEEYVLCDTRSV
jgi:hypothetical protein